MYSKLGIAAAGLLSGALLGLAAPCLADTTIIGGGFAAECSRSAKAAAEVRPGEEGMRQCDLAIDHELLSQHDLAATYVNRGVLFLSRQDYASAKRDFDKAAQIEPSLGEAHVNGGAALIGLGRDREGIAEINKGLALNASEPEKAYFNRALAEERLDDLKAAYADYQKALELRPDWAVAKTELARFHVVQR